MITSAELAKAAQQGFEFLAAQADLQEVEVFVAANGQLLTRLNYTSHIPCNGVEEPKSTESYGIGVQAVFKASEGLKVGFGSEPSDLTLDGVKQALEKARRGAVHDPEFHSLPKPTGEARTLSHYHDPVLLSVEDEHLVKVGWKAIRGALGAFIASSKLAELAEGEIEKLGLILGGDVAILQERIAVISSHLSRVQTDDSTLIMAFLTAMVEGRDAKGSGWATGTRLDQFTDEVGADAVQNAINALDGQRVPSGEYTVIFGKQPVADLLNNLVLPACTAGCFYSSSTPFLGKLGQPVASPLLTIYDHGAMPGFMGSKGITCEGLPTRRTDLIKHGVLTGCLTNWYEAQRLLHDPQLTEKLGVDAGAARRALVAGNGFRFAGGGGRHFDIQPAVAASNILVEGTEPTSLNELIAKVRDGLYIGRIWYTYPVNGLRAGDFTCTVVGDSFIIRDGRLVAPLRANTIRINDNVTRVLNAIIGITTDVKGTLVWAADEVVYATEMAVTGVRVDAIAGFMDALEPSIP
ncbi:MAG: TldD/PmbA family protein [Candidatus Methylomirabilia bacterium]